MATEPPSKRLRLTYPEPGVNSDSDNDQDGDELVFEPEEISERRDPDVKLMRKRMKAHSRFEQAFSDIFSKYAKNFSEVGDELDWRTGEVILNNGHLQNMRHDLDIGVDEEEGGILLEDLGDDVDDDDDEGVRLEDLPDGDGDWESEDEEERIMRGHAALPSVNITKLNSLSGPPAASFARSWEDVPAMDWSKLPAQKPRRTIENDASAWTSYSGAQSIWAPEPGYEEHWTPGPSSRVGTIGSLRQTASSPKLLPPPPGTSSAAADRYKHKSLGFEGVANSGDLSDDGDDLMAACPTTEPSEVSRGSPSTSRKVITMRTMRGLPKKAEANNKSCPKPTLTPKPSKPTSKSRQKASIQKSTPRSTPFNQLVVHRKLLTPTPPPLDPNCRRSTRTRYQTDYLGMTSSAIPTRKKASNIVVELPTHAVRKEDYWSVLHRLPTPPESGEEAEDVGASSHKRIIPDSQETIDSRENSPPRVDMVRDVDKQQAENVGGEGQEHQRQDTMSLQQRIETKQPQEQLETTASETLETPAKEARPGSRSQSRKSLRQVSCQQQPSPEPDLVTATAAGSLLKTVSKHQGRFRESPRSVADRRLPQELPDSQEKFDEPEEQTIAMGSQEEVQAKEKTAQPSNSARHTGEDLGHPPDAHHSDDPILVSRDMVAAGIAVPKEGTPPDLEATQSMDIDAALANFQASHKSHIQPLSSGHTIADSTGEPSSSAPPVKLQITPSRKHKTTSSKATPSKVTPSRLSPSKACPKPSTPRQSALRLSKTPISRRSVISLLSDNEDSDTSTDELLWSDDLPRMVDSPSTERLTNKMGSVKKITLKTTPLTTEIYRTPLKKKRRRGDSSPGDVAGISGGTTRTCGIDDYKCRRDFCFTCL